MEKKPSGGERIRALRRSRGENQAEFGKVLGVGQGAISAWELDDKARAPSADAFFRLADLAKEPEDKLLFLANAGLTPKTIQSAARRLEKDFLEDHLESSTALEVKGDVILIPRCRYTVQGREEIGPPVPVAVELIANPASTVCVVLETAGIGRGGGFAIVDTVDSDSVNLASFWGQAVLAEFAPRSEREDYPGWPEGIVPGVLYLEAEEGGLEGTRWIANLLPVGRSILSTFPVVIGMWIERRPIPARTLDVPADKPLAKAEDIRRDFFRRHESRFPRLPGEDEAQWAGRIGRAIADERETTPFDLFKSPTFLAATAEIKASKEVRLAAGCTILGRVIGRFSGNVK